MTNAMIREKIKNLETEIMFLKNAIIEKPDFNIDEKNWKKIKPDLKKVKAKIFKRVYA